MVYFDRNYSIMLALEKSDNVTQRYCAQRGYCLEGPVLLA